MSKSTRRNKSVQSALVKASIVTIFCLFIFIIAIGATTSTKKLTTDDSTWEWVMSGTPISAETRFESSSTPSDPPSPEHRPESRYHRSNKQRILNPQLPLTSTPVAPPPPYASENGHGFFRRRHNPNLLHRRFAYTQSRNTPPTSSPSVSFIQQTYPSDSPTPQPFQEDTSTSTSFPATTPNIPTHNARRSLTSFPFSPSYYTSKTEDPITAPTLTLLTFLSLSLLGLLLYLGWVLVWREFGLGVMLEHCVILAGAADC